MNTWFPKLITRAEKKQMTEDNEEIKCSICKYYVCKEECVLVAQDGNVCQDCYVGLEESGSED